MLLANTSSHDTYIGYTICKRYHQIEIHYNTTTRSTTHLPKHHNQTHVNQTTTTTIPTTTTTSGSILLPLTGYDYMGRRVILGRLGLFNPSKNSANILFKALSMVTDCMLEEDEQASVTGCVAIGDNADMSLSHVYIFTPSLAKKAMVLWQVRRKGQYASLGSLIALWDGRWGGHMQGYCDRVGYIVEDFVIFMLPSVNRFTACKIPSDD